MKFERIYQVNGTLDDFLQKVGEGPEKLLGKIIIVNQQMREETKKFMCGGYQALLEFISDEFGYIPSKFFPPTEYVDSGFITNSCDSLIARMWSDQQFQAEMKMTLACDKDSFSFEVEDNGTGIDPEIEPSLFLESVRSKKMRSDLNRAFIGGVGIHMYYSGEKIEQLGGTIYFENKGPNQGARFWYEVPLEALSRT